MWRMGFGQLYSYYLPWGASAEEVQAAVANVRSSNTVQVSRKQISVGFGTGYQYSISMMNELGTISQSAFTVDISQLQSVLPTNNFGASVITDIEGSYPANYRYEWIYAGCKYAAINSSSSHQVIVITTASPDVYGSGSFRLSFASEATNCISYNASLQDIRSALIQLSLISTVYAEEFHWISATAAYREVHLFFEGDLVDEWPMLKVVSYDNGRNWGTAYPNSCETKSITTTDVNVLQVDDNTACSQGSSDVQVLIAEAEGLLYGSFLLYFRGAPTIPISVDASASDVASALNQLLPGGGVAVTRFLHRDSPYTGYAWLVTFPESLGNVEYLFADDSHVTGVNAAVAVYPLVNVTMTADVADISGHFSLALGSEATIPLSWNATDGAVIAAVQNLSSISKAVIVGYGDYETPARLQFNVSVHQGATSNITLGSNVTGLIAPGDPVLFNGYNDTYAGRYITAITILSSNSTMLQISEAVNIVASGNVLVQVGTLKYSRVQLPGRVSVLSNSSMTNFVVYISQSWAGLVFAGDTIWVGEFELMVVSTPNPGTFAVNCSATVIIPFTDTIAFRWGKGYERSIVIKSATTEVRNARGLLLGDMRGTNLIVRTDHSDGVAPNTFLLGALFAEQTVSFRPDSLAVSLSAKSNASQYELIFGSESATSVNLTYGSSAALWKSVIESMINVDRVEVTRTGDGQSPIYAYGNEIGSCMHFS